MGLIFRFIAIHSLAERVVSVAVHLLPKRDNSRMEGINSGPQKDRRAPFSYYLFSFTLNTFVTAYAISSLLQAASPKHPPKFPFPL